MQFLTSEAGVAFIQLKFKQANWTSVVAHPRIFPLIDILARQNLIQQRLKFIELFFA